MPGNSTNETVERLAAANSELAQCLKRFEANIIGTNSVQIAHGYLEARKEALDKYWAKFESNHEKLVMDATEEDISNNYYWTNDAYSVAEEAYLNVLSIINDKRSELQRSHGSPAANSTIHNGIINNGEPLHSEPEQRGSVGDSTYIRSEFKLPRIELPKFDGAYKNWTSFYEMFKATVHDVITIPDVQKLHYLKSCLTAEAEQMIRHYQLSALNYTPAWETIVHRFENKRMLVDTQLKILFTQSPMVTESAQGLKQLLDTTVECLHSIKNLGINTNEWDILLIFFIVQKLPHETHLLWEQHLANVRDLPKWHQLQNFLEGRFLTLEILDNSKIEFPNQSSNVSKSSKSIQSYHTSVIPSCSMCKADHSVRDCADFKALDHFNRLQFRTDKGLCTNCLSAGHISNKCQSRRRCYVCKVRHYTLLHNPAKEQPTSTIQNVNVVHASETPASAATEVNAFHAHGCNEQILLATAIIRLESESGLEIVARALLDQGSQASFITESLARQLNLRRSNTNMTVNGIGTGLELKEETSFTINAHFQKKANLTVNALIIKKFPMTVTSSNLQSHNWDHINDLILADPRYQQSEKFDVLLGADIYADILLDGFRRGPIGGPIAQKTKLGWILSGHCEQSSVDAENARRNIVSMVNLVVPEFDLRRFWEIEEVSQHRRQTKEEELCETWFKTTHTRQADGRFVVRLPFIPQFETEKKLGRSRSIARSRLAQLEKRFQAQPEMYKRYADVINEYLKLGHMELTTNVESSTSCYLPHHAVIKESSTTTKLRVVFDASRATTSGNSLNSCLLVGPRLQQELFDITLRWRKHRIAMSGDVEKMYRQIRIHSDDADYQRILWRNNITEPVQDYRLCTVTFGTSSAPYLAVKVLQQVAYENKNEYPVAYKSIMQDFYVDDWLSGADTVEEAKQIRLDVVKILRTAGLEIKKWTSNSEIILEEIPVGERESQLPLHLDEEKSVKTLGLYWHPVADRFQFKVAKGPSIEHLTKRTLLSDISKIFDPNGWLSPVIITAKIMLQSLWLSGLSWDEELPNKTSQEWITFRNELQALENIKIARWINTTKTSTVQLHCFCDASEKAYAAAIYVRITDEQGRVITNLLTAKTRVAPVKIITLPRLELCAAVLGANLIKKVTEAMDFEEVALYAWTDSTIVLAWLQGQPIAWKTFVANRVVEIQQTVEAKYWRHVKSEENPADCASRGLHPTELEHHPLWWTGPSWLSTPEKNWANINSYNTAEEEKVHKIITMTTIVSQPNTITAILDNCSSWTKVLISTAYVRRFVHNVRTRNGRRLNGYIKIDELRAAKVFWIRFVQQSEFQNEMNCLSNNRPLSKDSKLTKLNPFVDATGCIRVGGRLENSNLSFNQKHPYILPHHHKISQLMIRHFHYYTMHGGIKITLHTLRNTIWIIRARNAVKLCIQQCITCCRHKSESAKQLMGQLPAARVKASRPFEHVGVDYAGPIELKWHKGRGARKYKGYICLFICMATKAVHLEAVTDLTTNGFLAAFKRFVSRRGLCTAMYSDCGTNFVGAARKLKSDFNRVKTEQRIAQLIAQDGVEWHFNPPSAPHFGGLWEAAVKSTKNHLKRAIGLACLTFEEMSTLLSQIEAILNSRPLCAVNDDLEDLSAITPGHFLIGKELIAAPEPSYVNINEHCLDRWKRIQQLQQSFWKKWQLDYLHQLQPRTKWMISSNNLKVNDMVLIKEDNLPPLKWLLGRIISTKPGTDQRVRVVTVKTKNGIIDRPIAKLCLLPIAQEQSHAMQ